MSNDIWWKSIFSSFFFNVVALFSIRLFHFHCNCIESWYIYICSTYKAKNGYADVWISRISLSYDKIGFALPKFAPFCPSDISDAIDQNSMNWIVGDMLNGREPQRYTWHLRHEMNAFGCNQPFESSICFQWHNRLSSTRWLKVRTKGIRTNWCKIEIRFEMKNNPESPFSPYIAHVIFRLLEKEYLEIFSAKLTNKCGCMWLGWASKKKQGTPYSYYTVQYKTNKKPKLSTDCRCIYNNEFKIQTQTDMCICKNTSNTCPNLIKSCMSPSTSIELELVFQIGKEQPRHWMHFDLSNEI